MPCSGMVGRMVVRCMALLDSPYLSDDQQSHVWNDIEDYYDYFEQPDERVEDHGEGFSGHGESFVLRTVHKIRE